METSPIPNTHTYTCSPIGCVCRSDVRLYEPGRDPAQCFKYKRYPVYLVCSVWAVGFLIGLFIGNNANMRTRSSPFERMGIYCSWLCFWRIWLSTRHCPSLQTRSLAVVFRVSWSVQYWSLCMCFFTWVFWVLICISFVQLCWNNSPVRLHPPWLTAWS